MKIDALWLLFAIVVLATLSAFGRPVLSIGTDSKYEEAVRIIARQQQRWRIAADQDENPLIRALHANYASSWLQTADAIATEEDVKRITGVSLKDMERVTYKTQDKANLALIEACPSIAPEAGTLAQLAGEGPP